MSYIEFNKEEEKIAADILSDIPNTYQKTVGFFIWDIVRAISIEIKKIYNIILYIIGMRDLNNFDYEDLVLFVKQRRGIIAKKASCSTGELTLLIGSGRVHIGDLFETSSKLQFISLETKDLLAGDTFKVECTTPGVIGNVPQDSISIMPITIDGFVKINNETPMTEGYEAETKESLIERYLDDLQKPITSGNIYQYQKWAKEVTGVADARIKPLWNGDNTVKIVLLDSNKEIPTDDLVKEVQNYIDPYELLDDGTKKGLGCGNGVAPIGAYCTVVAADPLNLDISVTLTLKSNVLQENAHVAVEEVIRAYLKSIAFRDNHISYAKIGAAILQADEIMDYNGLLINNSIDNIPLLDNDTTCQVGVLHNLILSFEA